MKHQLILLYNIVICIAIAYYRGGVVGDDMMAVAALLCVAFALGEWPWDRI